MRTLRDEQLRTVKSNLRGWIRHVESDKVDQLCNMLETIRQSKSWLSDTAWERLVEVMADTGFSPLEAVASTLMTR